MKFNVSSTKLFAPLQTVSRVVASKNTLPILDNILFELEDGTLTLTASDGETMIRTSIPVEQAEGTGKVAFGARLLLDTLKGFSEQPLAFQIDDHNFGLNITSPNGSYSVVGVNGMEYPKMPQDDYRNAFTISSETLLDAVNKTSFCMADDELRPVMNGVYFDLAEDRITLVATDAHRLARYINTAVKPAQTGGFILPKKPALILRQILLRDGGDVTVRYGDKNISFSFGQTTVVGRQIEGRFPNYNAVIPQNNTNEIVVDRQTLINACRRVAIFANSGTGLLRLALAADQIKISAQDIDFSTSAEETVACSYTGTPMAIGFKAQFLIDILSTITSTDVKLKLADPARAGLILPADSEENQELLILLMPMLLND